MKQNKFWKYVLVNGIGLIITVIALMAYSIQPKSDEALGINNMVADISFLFAMTVIVLLIVINFAMAKFDKLF